MVRTVQNIEDFALQSFAGSVLLQACFGENDIILRFDRDNHVKIFDRAVMSTEGVLVAGAWRLCMLDDFLGCSVKSLSVTGSILRINFDIGSIVLSKTSDYYENFELMVGEQSVVN